MYYVYFGQDYIDLLQSKNPGLRISKIINFKDVATTNGLAAIISTVYTYSLDLRIKEFLTRLKLGPDRN